MPQEKLGNGVLMKNGYKEEGDNKPEYTGPCTLMVNGMEQEAEIAAWLKTASKDTARLKTGDKYFSFQISEKFKKDIAPQNNAPDDDQPPF
jgi:hypothetical protein|tara:strand:- start:964 stop:1236 length:273 start_codon:yes stop_codon:yes gene_type:complete